MSDVGVRCWCHPAAQGLPAQAGLAEPVPVSRVDTRCTAAPSALLTDILSHQLSSASRGVQNHVSSKWASRISWWAARCLGSFWKLALFFLCPSSPVAPVIRIPKRVLSDEDEAMTHAWLQEISLSNTPKCSACLKLPILKIDVWKNV